jgi:hypothetical protein
VVGLLGAMSHRWIGEPFEIGQELVVRLVDAVRATPAAVIKEAPERTTPTESAAPHDSLKVRAGEIEPATTDVVLELQVGDRAPVRAGPAGHGASWAILTWARRSPEEHAAADELDGAPAEDGLMLEVLAAGDGTPVRWWVREPLEVGDVVRARFVKGKPTPPLPDEEQPVLRDRAHGVEE